MRWITTQSITRNVASPYKMITLRHALAICLPGLSMDNRSCSQEIDMLPRAVTC